MVGRIPLAVLPVVIVLLSTAGPYPFGDGSNNDALVLAVAHCPHVIPKSESMKQQGNHSAVIRAFTTAWVSGGGHALPICRATDVFVPTKRYPGGNDCKVANSTLVTFTQSARVTIFSLLRPSLARCPPGVNTRGSACTTVAGRSLHHWPPALAPTVGAGLPAGTLCASKRSPPVFQSSPV